MLFEIYIYIKQFFRVIRLIKIPSMNPQDQQLLISRRAQLLPFIKYSISYYYF